MLVNARKKGWQWSKEFNSITDVTSQTNYENFWNDSLPPCSLRSNCNWYHQNGVFACKVCIYVENGKCAKEPQTW